MKLIIQDRNSIVFNGISISDEVKSQVTDINFVTKEINFRRNLSFLERMKVRIFGNYTKTGDFLESTVLKKGKKYSIYIDGKTKQNFCKGTLIIECASVFINEIGEIFVEAVKSEDALNVQ